MSELKRTVLYSLHQRLGAKMVPFAGYEMPVQYPMGILGEHLHVREKSGIFDVSHMGQVVVSGAGAAGFLESVLPIDVDELAVDQQKYSVLLNREGGIVDDLMVVNRGVDFLLVVNASRKDVDLAHLRQLSGSGVEITELTDQALVAVQGPMAVQVTAGLLPCVADLRFMQGAEVTFEGRSGYATRSGYTGEDGLEISLPGSVAEAFVAALLSDPSMAMIGLGARDSLRLEAGLCLYGNDLDETRSLLEAGLGWVISKRRRQGGDKAFGYCGADRVRVDAEMGVRSQRVCLRVNSKVPVRHGAELVNAQGRVVGEVTSGGFAPSLGAPVAMGYVESKVDPVGLNALVRGKSVPVEIVKGPFVPHRYMRG